ncbi:MAG: ACT domain-containing protein [Vicinamibacteria bacterium]
MKGPRTVSAVTAAEVEAFLKSIPFSVDRPGFLRFALGFPQRYLATTPPPEVVRHYALMESLGGRAVISAIAREEEVWKLSIVAKDRGALFSRIAGALSCFGMNIVAAEAFANANSLVLDTFHFADREGLFEDGGERRRFQVFLEDVVEGKADVEAELARHPEAASLRTFPLTLEWNDDVHPTATRLSVGGHDRFGLLYRLSGAISDSGINIEMAYIDTPGAEVRDEFFLTRDGGRLTASERVSLTERLRALGGE